MTLLQEKTADVGKEKHVPVIERTSTGLLVKVGSIPHPMEEKHYIEWVEIIGDGAVQRKCLKSGMKPEAIFETRASSVRARIYCNIHGLWKSQ
jgi:superoxide reductase